MKSDIPSNKNKQPKKSTVSDRLKKAPSVTSNKKIPSLPIKKSSGKPVQSTKSNKSVKIEKFRAGGGGSREGSRPSSRPSAPSRPSRPSAPSKPSRPDHRPPRPDHRPDRRRDVVINKYYNGGYGGYGYGNGYWGWGWDYPAVVPVPVEVPVEVETPKEDVKESLRPESPRSTAARIDNQMMFILGALTIGAMIYFMGKSSR
jgi:hypothetical protein